MLEGLKVAVDKRTCPAVKTARLKPALIQVPSKLMSTPPCVTVSAAALPSTAPADVNVRCTRIDGANVPAAHATQSADPLEAANSPGRQSWHVVEAVAPKLVDDVPATHNQHPAARALG
jgi:hypothetical protein